MQKPEAQEKMLAFHIFNGTFLGGGGYVWGICFFNMHFLLFNERIKGYSNKSKMSFLTFVIV